MKMNDKREIDTTKLFLLLIGLGVVWILCNMAEQQFPKRFQDELINRIGKRDINSTRIELSMKIKLSIIQQEITKDKATLNQMLKETYNLETEAQEQHICLIVRDFDMESKQDYQLTVKSIQSQNYSNFKVIYLTQQQNDEEQRLKPYLESNKISTQKYTVITAKHDTIEALFNASVKCLKSSIVVLIENKEQFASSLVLKVINSHFKNQVELVWGTSLYSNEVLGFSFDYNDKIKQNKEFRKYPLAMNDVVAYRNELLSKTRNLFQQHHLNYPLSMSQSFGFTFLEYASKFTYIPEILTFKSKQLIFRSERSQFDKTMQNLIRKDQSIGPLLKTQLNNK